MKSFFYIILILLLSACGADKLPAIPAGTTVLILGDSLSYGTGAKEGEDYPRLLAKNTAWQIVNAGIPGNTSQQGLDRLPALIETHQPKVLMIALGGNDFLRNVDEKKTIANLKAAITKAKANNIQAVLIAIPAFSPFKAAFTGLDDHEIYQDIAEEMQVPLVEDVFSEVLSDTALKADAIHPNAKGYRAVEALMRDALLDLGLLAN